MVRTQSDGPHTRGHKKKERTRALLIASAIDVIAEQGEAFNIGDITAHAGVAHGTFYNYFPDRDALIEAVIPEALTALAVESATMVDVEDPAARFAIITSLTLQRGVVAPEETRLLLRLDAVQRAIVSSPAMDPLRADLAAGAETGRFLVGPDAATLDVIVGTLLFASRRIVDEAVDERYPVGIVAQLLRSLGIPADEAHELAEHAVPAARALAESD